MSESNLYIAKWIESSEEWIELESTIDLDSQTVTTMIDGFSIYTVMARPQPASFTLSDLTINPEKSELGGSIDISVILTNNGDLAGNYEVSLSIDDVQVQSSIITLVGSESEQVTFSITLEAAGTYAVSVGDLTGQCEVIPPVAPPASAPTAVLPPTPTPASFAISDFSIYPREVKPAEPVKISALISNNGGSDGIYTAVFEVNGTEEVRREVILGAGKSETVTCTIVKETEGSYAVNIDGKAGQFIVIVPAPPIPASVKVPSLQPSINRGLIFSFIAGCFVFVVELLAYFFIWRQRDTLLLPVARRKQKRSKVGFIYSILPRWRL
jgi:hypothetical protein